MEFSELGISPHLVENLRKHKITEPMPVQEKAIPLLMQGKDVVVRSKTGSGKTIAFLVPIVQQLNAHDKKHVQALVLEPTRELAVQVGKDLHILDPHVSQVVVYGGVGIEPQIMALREGRSVLMGTPGRILDHLARGTLDLSHVRFVVLDEGDRMLDMGFIDDIREILKRTPHERQTTMFSATMPDEIYRLSKNYMRSPERLILEQDEIVVAKIKQEFYGCMPRQKLDAMMNYLTLHRAKISKTLVFTNTKHWADTMTRILRGRGYNAHAIHSNLSQAARERVLSDFKANKFNILIATDVAARGLHIPEVSHVINYDLPKNGKDYIHRVGRTGRVGAEGHAVSFLATEDSAFLRDIERETGQYIEVKDITDMVIPSRHEHLAPGHVQGEEYPHERESERGGFRHGRRPERRFHGGHGGRRPRREHMR